MFLIRNRALAWSVRHSRDIFKTNQKAPSSPEPPASSPPTSSTATSSQASSTSASSFTFTSSSSGFPYRFGGISSYPRDVPKLNLFLPKDTPPMQKAYFTVLQAIQEKDEKVLSRMVEPSIAGPLLRGNPTDYQGKGSEGRVLTHKLDITIGTYFQRETGIKFKRMDTPNEEIGLFVPEQFNPSDYMSKGGLPVLLTLQTTIISKARLVAAVEKDVGGVAREEAHSVWFQYESIFGLQDMMGMMAKLPLMKMSSDQDMLKGFLFRGSGSWRVGNIDNFLPPRWD